MIEDGDNGDFLEGLLDAFKERNDREFPENFTETWEGISGGDEFNAWPKYTTRLSHGEIRVKKHQVFGWVAMAGNPGDVVTQSLTGRESTEDLVDILYDLIDKVEDWDKWEEKRKEAVRKGFTLLNADDEGIRLEDCNSCEWVRINGTEYFIAPKSATPAPGDFRNVWNEEPWKDKFDYGERPDELILPCDVEVEERLGLRGGEWIRLGDCQPDKYNLKTGRYDPSLEGDIVIYERYGKWNVAQVDRRKGGLGLKSWGTLGGGVALSDYFMDPDTEVYRVK